MSDKLSPKDFDSITEWIKQYIGTEPEPTEQLLSPIIAVKSNTHTELIYTVNNPNEVDAYFNGDLISAKGQSELTHIWNEDSFTISGNLTAKGYIASDTATLTVERAPDTVSVKVQLITSSTSAANNYYTQYKLKFGNEITVNSIQLGDSGSFSFYDTRDSYSMGTHIYSAGSLVSPSIQSSSITAEDNVCQLCSFNTYTKTSSLIYDRFIYGNNESSGEYVSYASTNILTFNKTIIINYTYNGNTESKEFTINMTKDIASLNGLMMYSNAVNSFNNLDISTTINI